MHIDDRYLHELDEEELGIRFQEARKTKEWQDRLHTKLETVAKILGVPVIPAKIPPKGFILQNLTAEQKFRINELLGERYAQHNEIHRHGLLNVGIEECNEKMVSLKKIMKDHETNVLYSGKKFHSAAGPYANKERIWYSRMEMAHSLAKIFRAFNRIGLTPHIEDAWRPPEVQRGLFIRRVVKIARTHRDWDWSKVKMVASSITASAPGIAGHQAGAAVDVVLFKCHGKKPRRLPLGNDYPEGSVVSSIHFPYVTFHQWETRTLFANTMRMGGFKLLPTEDWHASMNDRGMGIDGILINQTATYGPIKQFDQKGHISSYLDDEFEASIDTPFLSDISIQWLIEKARHQDAHGKVTNLRMLADMVIKRETEFRTPWRSLLENYKPA